MARLNRRLIEELLIITGVIGLLFVFQPFNNMLYTLGWIALMASTLGYVIFTLVPQNVDTRTLVRSYLKTLLIVLIIVIAFIVLSISLMPVLIR